MIIAVHQPNFFPWLGFFNKMLNADCFIFLDDVQYVRRSVITRAKIRGHNGLQWLTLPVSTGPSSRVPIHDVSLMQPVERWVHKHKETLRYSYGRSQYYEEITTKIINPAYDWVLNNKNIQLSEWNMVMIMAIRSYLSIDTLVKRSSDLNSTFRSTERLIDLVRKAGGTTYLSGKGGLNYQDPELFEKEGIELQYNMYECPQYPQGNGEFIPGLSILDCLFTSGTRTREYLEQSPVTCMA